jgi:hypothetical protein
MADTIEGTAEKFEQAQADFEAAWQEYLSQCTENDFGDYRRQRAWTAWKYAMYDAGLPLPAQLTAERSRCFCGDAIDIAGLTGHVYGAHMTDLQRA